MGPHDRSATIVDAEIATSVRGPQIRPRGGLPGGRAVVGALLVTAGAVGVFAAYLDATSPPTTHYLVSSGRVAPGTVIDERAMALELFSSAAIDLDPPVEQRVLSFEDVDTLVGQTILIPLERGELLQRSAVGDVGGPPDTQAMSFAVPRSDAVAGALSPGERVDVLATHAVGRGTAFTGFVTRGVPLLAVDEGNGESVVLTVAVSSSQVQALGHAVNTATVFVARSAADADLDAPLPDPYVPTVDGWDPTGDAFDGSGAVREAGQR